MALETFDILVLYKAIELVLLFWLLGLLFKWVLTFIFGEKGAKIIGFIGYAINYSLKKFVLTRLFKIEVQESDPFKLSFKHEETKRWDILFTSLVLIPMGIGLFLGVIVGTIGLLLESDLVILSIFLYIAGFFIAVNSIPSYQDIKEITDCSGRSIIIWFVIASLLCALFAAVTVPFIDTLGIILSVIIGVFVTSLLTFYLPFISDRMTTEESSSLIGGTIDLDG
ncbi:MAG TPA: hypothetical protein VMX55_00650 [candidate division Zixibacteria bacterium]|nr:hypothetical protein [candidate division Zixibacteria bacterium]